MNLFLDWAFILFNSHQSFLYATEILKYLVCTHSSKSHPKSTPSESLAGFIWFLKLLKLRALQGSAFTSFLSNLTTFSHLISHLPLAFNFMQDWPLFGIVSTALAACFQPQSRHLANGFNRHICPVTRMVNPFNMCGVWQYKFIYIKETHSLSLSHTHSPMHTHLSDGYVLSSSDRH